MCVCTFMCVSAGTYMPRHADIGQRTMLGVGANLFDSFSSLFSVYFLLHMPATWLARVGGFSFLHLLFHCKEPILLLGVGSLDLNSCSHTCSASTLVCLFVYFKIGSLYLALTVLDFVDKAGLELSHPSASTFQMLRLKMCATMPGSPASVLSSTTLILKTLEKYSVNSALDGWHNSWGKQLASRSPLLPLHAGSSYVSQTSLNLPYCLG